MGCVGLRMRRVNSVVLQENTPAVFSWRGSFYGLFIGVHQFHFKPSEKIPGGTTLVQKEDFSGILAFLVNENMSSGKKTRANFEALNKDLKAKAESV